MSLRNSAIVGPTRGTCKYLPVDVHKDTVAVESIAKLQVLINEEILHTTTLVLEDNKLL